MASVQIHNLVKLYGPLRAVDGITLAVEEGEFFALLGPSGCGKTTALRCIAGLERPSQGEIFIGPQSVTHLPPYGRPCGMVFQSYALFPHLPVFDNVAYGLRAREYRQGGLLRKMGVLGSFLGRRMFPLHSALPLALPGIPLAIAMILAFNTPPLKLTGTALLLIIAYVVRRMPYALRSTTASIRAIGSDLEEASFVLGAPRFLSLRGVTLPLMLPGIFAGAIMVFLTSIREISATILLAPQGWKPMSLVIFEGLLRGEFYTSSAISMILITIVIALQYMVFRLVGEKALF